MKLMNRNVVITGGNGGIARVVIKRLLDEGAKILSADICLPTEEWLVSEKYGKAIRFLKADVTDIESIEEARRICHDAFGGPDILINSAGIQEPIGPLHSIDIKAWAKNIEVNLMGTVNCVKVFMSDFIAAGKGKIINFAGGGSTSPRVNFSAYGVSKTGVIRFTETIAEELKPYNIQVNAVSPGVIKTNMIDEILKKDRSVVGDEYEMIEKRMNQGFDSPDRVAGLIAYLASDESNVITGKTISAVWDPWEQWRERNIALSRDSFTLRRIDERNYVKREKI